MKETHISFYLNVTRIRIFVDTLRALGQPSRICFMIEENGATLLIVPYDKRDFISHSVPAKVYDGNGNMRINSYKLCHIIAEIHNWDLTKSYRVPGKVYTEKKVAVFDLKNAQIIE